MHIKLNQDILEFRQCAIQGLCLIMLFNALKSQNHQVKFGKLSTSCFTSQL